ncbi:MAG: GGDEF domain-containing protein [Solirubrobacterales bacterium]
MDNLDANARGQLRAQLSERLRGLITPRPDDELDPLGMPFRLHYAILAFTSLVMGSIPLIVSFTAQPVGIDPWALRSISAASVVLAFVFVWLGKRAGNKRDLRIYYLAAASLYGAILIGVDFTGDLKSAMAAILLIAPITVGYYLSFREGLPVVVVGLVVIAYASTGAGESDSVLRIATLSFLAVACWLTLLVIKRQLVSAIDHNRELSMTDSLTGAANIRRMRTLLDEEAARANRRGDGFALFAFDLDDFRQVNQRYGPRVGDTVLLATADAARSVLTDCDTLVRRGGDEFAVIAPMIAGRDPLELRHQLADAIDSARKALSPNIQSTASIGWVEFEPGESVDALIQRTDNELRAAKSLSRDGVRQTLESVDSASHDSELPAVARTNSRDRSVIKDPTMVALAFAWRQAGLIFASAGAMFVVLTAIPSVPIEFSPLTVGIITVAVLSVPLCWWISVRVTEPRFLTHGLAIGSPIVLLLFGLANPDAARDTAEFFVLPILFQMYLLRTRTALIYALGSVALMGIVFATHDTAYPVLRLIVGVLAIGLVALILAIARQRTLAAAQESADLARIDALTGLPNMRRLHDRLDAEARRCETTGSSLSLMIVDLDEFKSVNDRYGHSRGDTVLIAVADALSDSVRRSEMPARRGGDEFAVVLADVGESDLEVVSLRLSGVIERARSLICPGIRPTVTVGTASWREGMDADDLVKEADAALREAQYDAGLSGPRPHLYAVA